MSTSSAVVAGFAELERQRQLIASCTALYKELSDHFSSVERCLELRSESVRSNRRTLDISTQRKLAFLQRREESIDGSVDIAIARVEKLRGSYGHRLSSAGDDTDLPAVLRTLCAKMDSDAFFDLIVSSRKESDLLRKEIPLALKESIDPANFVMDAIARVFPVDRRAVKSPPGDLGWVCVLLLESLVSVLADPELGAERPLVTRIVKERAKEIADSWKHGMEERGGVLENAKAQDVHAFLQHLVTFGIGVKEEREFYMKLVVNFSRRKQMPKLATSLGLEDKMSDIIEELIVKGHQLDAINFAYESGLQEKYPPVPLLKSYLKDTKKAAAMISEDPKNSGHSANNACRKEPSAIRAVMKCIEEHELEAKFPTENLQKRLENLEKAKAEKRKAAGGPANKRTRTNNGGPMPPAKAGRLTSNAHVSSFPGPMPAFVMSPSNATAYSTPPFSPYPYERAAAGHGFYGSHSPPAMREVYAYPTEEMSPTSIAVPYPSPPISYPTYGGYVNGIGAYGNIMPPRYQQTYYR